MSESLLTFKEAVIYFLSSLINKSKKIGFEKLLPNVLLNGYILPGNIKPVKKYDFICIFKNELSSSHWLFGKRRFLLAYNLFFHSDSNSLSTMKT